MSHEWHRGVLETSSWHGLEEVGVMVGADGMIEAGERTGAWPVSLEVEAIVTKSGLPAPGGAVVATYQDGSRTALSVMSAKYPPATPQSWRNLVRAVVAAGGRPTGAFALRDGKRVLATFEIGKANGLRTHLVILDSFDGTKKFTVGCTSVRVVCANTLSAAMSQDGAGMAKIRHDASLEENIAILSDTIGEAIKTGDKVRVAYERAEKLKPTKKQRQAIFDKLFPAVETEETMTAGKLAAQTKAENARQDALKVAAMPINNVGDSLATLWNAATYLVDRMADGSARPCADPLDSMLFGTRAARIQEIETIIQVIMADGSIREMSAKKAVEEGVDSKIVGKKVLQEMMDA